jgi:peroxiredoxin Q/BCP
MIAPQFCLPNQDETEICLRDLKGKWVILYFYPKDNSSGCSTQASDFTENLDWFEDKDAIIIGISPDTPKTHRNFIEKKELTITLLSDEEKRVIKQYGAWGIKKNYGKEYEGVIRSTFIISPNGEIVKEFKNVKAKGHVQRIKTEFEKLKNGI